MKRLLIALACFGLFAGTAQGETLNLKLADDSNADYPIGAANLKFAELVKERTGGRINIKVYLGGQLGDEKDTLEQLQFGSLDFAKCALAPLTQFDAKFSVLILPYLYRDIEHQIKVFQSDVGKDFLGLLSDQNAVGVAWYAAMPRNFYNSKRPVNSPADLKGLKIRVQEADIMIDLVRALGALPQPLPYSEVYTAIQTGVIDGAENDWSSYVIESHNEVAKQISDDAHTIVPEILFISKKLLDSLSDADRKIVLDAAGEAAEFQWNIIRKTESEFREKAKALGSTITHITDKAPFQKAVAPLYAKYGKGYADVIEAIRKM